MNERPKLNGDEFRVAMDAAFGAVGFDFGDHVGETGMPLVAHFDGLLQGRVLAEHQPENRGLLDGERDIGLAHRDDALERPWSVGHHRSPRPFRHIVEAARRDLFQDFVLVAEMTVGRGRADAGDPARVRQREILSRHRSPA